MKFFILLLAIGFASASVIDDVLKQAADEIVADFKKGLDEAPVTYDAEDTNVSSSLYNRTNNSMYSNRPPLLPKMSWSTHSKMP